MKFVQVPKNDYVFMKCLLLICSALLLVCSLLLIRYTWYYHYAEMTPSITFNNLTESQENHIQRILDEVKPHFLKKTSRMVFYPNNYIMNDNEATMGLNYEFGKIYIRYFEDDYTLRMIVCHELLHNFIRDEEVVYDLDETSICYD